jgi:hypothetical protein
MNGVSVTVSAEAAGANCPFGGTRVESVSGTSFVCNGGAGAPGPAGSPGVPCASCVDDASIVDRLVRVPIVCHSDGTVPFIGLGFRFTSNATGPLICSLERPTDVVDTQPARVVLTFQSLRGSGSVSVTVAAAPIPIGGFPTTSSVSATLSIPSMTVHFLRTTHQFTVAQLFGAAGVTTTSLSLGVSGVSGDLTLISGAVEYTATR